MQVVHMQQGQIRSRGHSKLHEEVTQMSIQFLFLLKCFLFTSMHLQSPWMSPMICWLRRRILGLSLLMVFPSVHGQPRREHLHYLPILGQPWRTSVKQNLHNVKTCRERRPSWKENGRRAVRDFGRAWLENWLERHLGKRYMYIFL